MSLLFSLVKNTPHCKEVAGDKGGTRIKSTVCVYHFINMIAQQASTSRHVNGAKVEKGRV